jgi:5-methylcytosine-specific restriction endonuclease McrA
MAPRRAYGTLRHKGKSWKIGNWKIDPASVRKVKGTERKALVRIFEKTSGHCHFCGDPLDFEKVGRKYPKGWEKDHIIPKKQGGTRRQDNLLPAHWRCNALRWARGFDKLKEVIRVGLIGVEEMNIDERTGRRLAVRLANRKIANRKRRARYRQAQSG